MNQLVHIFNESNLRYNELNSIPLMTKLERLKEKREEAKLQVKTIGTMIHLYSVGVKATKLEKAMENLNIIDSTSAIEIPGTDPETDKVKCPGQDALMIRVDCLDYSGQHPDECGGCEIGRDTKARLLGPTE
jgi:hypothetical protein